MNVPWGILAPLIAVVITFAAMQGAVALTDAIRRRDYRRFEDQNESAVALRFPLPTISPSAADQQRKTLSPFWDIAHKAAGSAQTTYHNAVVRSAGCLVLAFLTLAFGALPPTDWPASARLDVASLELVLSWIEAIAILSMLVLFIYGRVTCRPWIASRTGAELLRQYQILSVVLPGAFGAAPIGDFKGRFDREARLIASNVQAGPGSAIAERIDRFWLDRKASIENHALGETDLTADALLVYLQRRARRQLAWFADSKARLEHISGRRNAILTTLYCLAGGVALVKHGWLLSTGHSPAVLLPLLLIVTGLSAATTAYYINQNSRSLIHRYHTQERSIAHWLTTFDQRWNFSSLPMAALDLVAKTEIRRHILQFEDLMIDELIDWIHITSYDAIELAP